VSHCASCLKNGDAAWEDPAGELRWHPVTMRTRGCIPSPVELAAQLIRFDTTNPPGSEAACVGHIAELLRAHAIPFSVHGRSADRPNLVARLEGRGSRPALLLHGHVDVVSVAGQQWRVPPFEGQIEDGMLWGRGAVDMKSGVAAMVTALLRVAAEEPQLEGDLVLAVTCDEEAGGDDGAGYLVREHPQLFDGVSHALSEGGGQSLNVAGARIHPIAVAEKSVCWLRATTTSRGGHGSMPIVDSAIERLALAAVRLGQLQLPLDVTPPATLMFEGLRAAIEDPEVREAVGLLLVADRVEEGLRRLPEGLRRAWTPLVRDTVAVTGLAAGEKINMIPAQGELLLDCRLLPGHDVASLVAAVQSAAGPDIEIQVLRSEQSERALADLSHLSVLSQVIVDVLGTDARCVASLSSGFTDGRQFAKLGIQTYGFLPCRIDHDWVSTIHAVDERIPITAIEECARGLALAAIRMLM
jgi:acetylornithine deacetylase/succinyl-diaminopimelate desuccinylase-like protein